MVEVRGEEIRQTSDDNLQRREDTDLKEGTVLVACIVCVREQTEERKKEKERRER